MLATATEVCETPGTRTRRPRLPRALHSKVLLMGKAISRPRQEQRQEGRERQAPSFPAQLPLSEASDHKLLEPSWGRVQGAILSSEDDRAGWTGWPGKPALDPLAPSAPQVPLCSLKEVKLSCPQLPPRFKGTRD